jgi:hypothetical protein
VCAGPGNPGNLNAVEIFQGLVPAANGAGNPNCSPATSSTALQLLNFSPNQQRFSCANGDPSCGVASPPSSSIFLTQNYLNPSSFLPLAFQPFGYPQGKNFVYAYSQQANLTFEHDLGGGYAISLAYNFNGGRRLNRPINANAVRGDLMVQNFAAAAADGQTASSPFTVGTGSVPCGSGPLGPWVSAPLMNFFRPGGLNPSYAAFYNALAPGCVTLAQGIETSLASQGFNANCNPATFVGCVPFGDMDANYSNGTSDYNGFSANFRKRFGSHYEFLASYTWSHAIDDSTDLQSTLTPQDSYIPSADRSTSLFDERHRFVFNGVYQSGRLGGATFSSRFFSNWTVAPLIEVGSGRPFNIITSGDDNLQLSSLTGRPNVVAAGTAPNGCGYPTVASGFSPTGYFQEPCSLPAALGGNWNGQIGLAGLASLDGNLGRNAGHTPVTVFNDMRVAKRVNFGERYSMDFIADMFNIANVYNVAAVSPLFTNAGQATAAYDPRQFQFALKLNW